MNIEELRAFAGEYLGKEVEFYNKGNWVKGILEVVDVDLGTTEPFRSRDSIDLFRWHTEARPPQPKQMRDMTIEELWGRTLVHPDGRACVVNTKNNDGYLSDNRGMTYSIEQFIEAGWKVNDKPSLDGAQELRVEVSE